jgi:hypothetical protein
MVLKYKTRKAKKMEWKVVVGFPDYVISDIGQIYSLKSKRLLSLHPRTDGYVNVGLRKSKNERKRKFVHRLVYEAFVGPIPEGYEVNHKDEVKSNNALSNLELLTHKQNMNYGTRTQRAKQGRDKWDTPIKHQLRKLKGRAVLQYTLDGVLVREWNTMAEAQENGYHRNCISDCCNGRKKTHKGYRWEYAK